MANPDARGFGAMPIPSAAQMKQAAASSGCKTFCVDGESDHVDDTESFPFQIRKRRMHLIQARVAEPAGVDLFDYFSVERAGPTGASRWLEWWRATRGLGLDAILIGPVLSPPSKVFGVGACQTTAVFDASLAEKGWGAIHGKKKLRQLSRNAEKQYQVSFETLTGDDIIPYLLTLSEMHIERWSFEGVSSPFKVPYRMDQYRKLVPVAVLNILRFDQEIAAIHYGFIWDEGILFHTPVINIKFLALSPLNTLIFYIARWMDDSGLRILDFGLGSEEYKKRFANSERRIHSLMIPLSLTGAAAAGVGALGRSTLVQSLVTRTRTVARRAARIGRNLLAPVHCFEVSGPSDSTTDVPSRDSRVRIVDIWETFVDLARRMDYPILKSYYDRFREGSSFACMVVDQAIVSSAWISVPRNHFVVHETGQDVQIAWGRVVFDVSVADDRNREGVWKALLDALAECFPRDRLVVVATLRPPVGIREMPQAGHVRFRP